MKIAFPFKFEEELFPSIILSAAPPLPFQTAFFFFCTDVSETRKKEPRSEYCKKNYSHELKISIWISFLLV